MADSDAALAPPLSAPEGEGEGEGAGTAAAPALSAVEDDPLQMPTPPIQEPAPPVGAAAAMEPEPEPQEGEGDDVDEEIEEAVEELEGLMAPAPAVEEEEPEGMLISPFSAAAGDSAAKAMLKSALTSRDGPELEASLSEAAASMETEEGRTALRELLEEGKNNARLDKRTFLNVVHVFETALRCVLQNQTQSDMQNASVYIGIVNTYYRLTPAGNRFLSKEDAIRSSPLWSNLEFWKFSVFEALAAERAKEASTQAKFSEMEEWQLKNVQEQEYLVAFNEVQKIMTQMLDFGQVSLDDMIQFRQDIEALQILVPADSTDSRSFDYLEQLDFTLASAAFAQTVSEWPPGLGREDWESSPYNTGPGMFSQYGFPVQPGEEGLYLKECLFLEKNPNPTQDAGGTAAWDEWLKAHAENPELRVGTRLVQNGIPHDRRALAWKALTAQARSEIQEFLGGIPYAEHVKEIGVAESPGRSKELLQWEKVIDQDLHRTFPGHKYVDTTEGKAALRRVLVAYANRNRDVGYCQSMNFITASLLIVTQDEEDAFWSLALFEERILKEYHSRHMLGCRTDCRFLMDLTKQYLPNAHQVFVEKQVIPEVAFIHWFLCVFVNSLPFGTAMRIWDKLMADMKDSNTLKKPLDVEFATEGRIGIQFKKDVEPVTIGQLAEGGLAAKNHRVKPGLVVTKVNGRSVASLSYSATMRHMKEVTKVRPVTLTFAESAPPTPTEVLLRVALAAIQILDRPLQAAQTAQDVNQLLRGGISQIFDGDRLLELAMNPKWVISSERRNQIRQELLDEQESVSKNRDQSKQMAEDRRAVQKAVNVMADKLLKGFVNPKDDTVLYGDEKNERIGGVRELGQRCVVRLPNNEVFGGTLFLTNYRVIFISFNRTETEVAPGAQPSREAMQRHFTISIPLMGILKTGVKTTLRLASGLDWVAPILKVTCKDARRFHFLFDDNLLTLLNLMNDNSPEDPAKIGERSEQQNHCRRTVHTQSLREPKNAIMKMFGGGSSSGGAAGEPQSPKEVVANCFHRQLESIRQLNLRKGSFMFERQASDGQWDTQRECWIWSEHWYDAPKEFERQGATDHDSPWRRSELNADFGFAPTYPKCLLVPKTFSDAELHEVAKFRSKQRLPVLSWFDKETDAAIIRCAQPLVGISGRKSAADARLFDHMTKANSNGKPLLLTDARAWAAAFANKGRKGGYEDVSHYEGEAATKPELVFLNIDNIHVMRSSISKMHKLVCSNKRNNIPVRRSEIFNAEWLTHMGRILGGCRVIVEATWERRSSVVHCSDGWDRTAQLCAGSEICLDPYYRTFEGFRTLLQREWHSFGHKVRDRTWGQLKPDGSIKADEISPVLLQYLDYCHQLMYAHPKCFEFNEWFLLALLDCLHKGCSNFQVNTERDYWQRREAGQTVEYWSFMDGEHRQQYVNPKYDAEYSNSYRAPAPRLNVTPKVGSIMPPRVPRVWEAYFNRFVASPVDGAPWWSVDGLPLWSRESEQKDIEERKARGLPLDGRRVDGSPAAHRQPTVDREAATSDEGEDGESSSTSAHTLEKIAGQAGVVSKCRPQIVEPKVKFEGWLWLSTYSGEQRRWVAFYPSVAGEANLVHFEPEEGSGSLIPKGVITLPSQPGGFLYTVQGEVVSDRVDRFPFNIIVYSSLDQRDGTTHTFAAETDEDHMMWVETFRQATRSYGLTDVNQLKPLAQSAAVGGRRTVREPQPIAASMAAAVASPRIALASAMGGGGALTPRANVSTPVIQHNEDGTLGLTLYKGQMGFGVNVSELSVVLDTRANAEEAGVRKGQLIVAINDVPTPTKKAVHTVLKSSANEAKFTVREPTLIEARARRKELVTVKMKKGWKTHFVLTIAQSYLFVQASFFSGPDLVSSQPVMTRKELGKEANEKEGGTLSQAFQAKLTKSPAGYTLWCKELQGR